MMNRENSFRRITCSFGAAAACLCLFVLPAAAVAGICDAYYAFDGDLEDGSGNGYTGQMIGPDGARTTPVFGEGRVGGALELDGESVMRAFLDLHFEMCPQVTIAAWVRLSPDGKNHWLVSTGAGQGPGLRVSDTALIAEGTLNGISESGVLRDAAGFFFIAGVWDYSAGVQRLYWRGRSSSIDMPVTGFLYPPEDAFWVGALEDNSLSEPAVDTLIDELRVYSRILTDAEIAALRSGDVPPWEVE